MSKTIIVNFGMGNIGSIANMIKKIGYKVEITDAIEKIKDAEKIILPGVGSFDHAMQNLEKLNFIDVINKKVMEEKTPLLGICLGMQLMADKSEEGNKSGLGFIDGEVKRFSFGEYNKFKIPHMGWNLIQPKKESTLLKNLDEESRFYFVHSYHFVCKNEADILTKTFYGYDFVSSFAKENIFGVQFHPEKSHKFGMKLLQNFIENL
ncbi:MAG: imidazole glycerol phosphate synthase subunit HisH [Melioribacteraceae bacterium]|nr:imidazole glycerol phosphate synthase subunit HisH [Melioribacteraceae bacterium]